MSNRRTQYKRNPRLRADYKRSQADLSDYLHRLATWQQVLEQPSKRALMRIADLLARLEYEPDEHGMPAGDWPPIMRMDPLVWLDSLKEVVDQQSKTTLAWKADVLEAATLVWAGVIGLDDDQIRKARCLSASAGDVLMMLAFTDLETFWNRPGVGLAKEDIRKRWQEGETLVDQWKLADWLRKARGGR